MSSDTIFESLFYSNVNNLEFTLNYVDIECDTFYSSSTKISYYSVFYLGGGKSFKSNGV